MNDSVYLFEAVNTRITCRDVVAISQLNLRCDAERLLFYGETSALFSVLTADNAEARIVGGTICINGMNVNDGHHLKSIGAAPANMLLPPMWNVETYVQFTAQMSGFSKKEAKALAHEALNRMGLASFARTTIHLLPVVVRRLVILAQAIVARPSTVIIQEPFLAIDTQDVQVVLQAIARVTEHRRTILSVTRMEPETPESVLVDQADHVVVLGRGGVVVSQGTPHELVGLRRVYRLTVRGDIAAFQERLGAIGIAWKMLGMAIEVALSPLESTQVLFSAAMASQATLLEVIPVA